MVGSRSHSGGPTRAIRAPRPDFFPLSLSLYLDPNTGVKMYESADICQYLTDTYGDGSGVVPNGITSGYGSTLAIGLALAPRIGKGSKAVPVRVVLRDCVCKRGFH